MYIKFFLSKTEIVFFSLNLLNLPFNVNYIICNNNKNRSRSSKNLIAQNLQTICASAFLIKECKCEILYATYFILYINDRCK